MIALRGCAAAYEGDSEQKIVSAFPFSNCSARVSAFVAFRTCIRVTMRRYISACGACTFWWRSTRWPGGNLGLAHSARRNQFIGWKWRLCLVFDRHFKATTLPSRGGGSSINLAYSSTHVWLDDWLGHGIRNPLKKWWLDLEIVDGNAIHPRKGVNERDLNLKHKIDPKNQKIAYYHASAMPPPNAKIPILINRDKALKR